jgi:hypothetical protein
MYWMLLPPDANVGRAMVDERVSLFVTWRDWAYTAWARLRDMVAGNPS